MRRGGREMTENVCFLGLVGVVYSASEKLGKRT